ncbi:PEP/pyruvate-binding domain-containing protein [Thermodesulfobacteriota bacterium]
MEPDICLWIDDLDSSFKVFHELMAHKIREILLVLSPYDAFIMEEDTSLSTRIINEYQGLNLSQPPRLTSVAIADEALELVRYKKFDLVITLPQIGQMDCNTLGCKIKEICPDLPVILLAHNLKAIAPYLGKNRQDGLDNFYIWSADPALLLALIKNIEDHRNVEWDTSLAMVRVLILVEDSPLYKSFFLPLLYKEIVAQTQAVMVESLNEEHRLLKMRARPKILVAKNYEEAKELYHKYKDYVFGIFSDTRFPKKGKMNDNAGIKLLSHIRKEIPDIPLLLLSSESGNAQKASGIPASFVNKNSQTLTEEIHHFFLENLGFGDFVFHMPDGKEIDRAVDLHSFEKKLATIPDESFLYHAENKHFSNWIMARSEIGLASRMYEIRIQDFESIDKLRQELIAQVNALRVFREKGGVAHFSERDFDADIMQFVKIGHGSMGGKALGLAFMVSQLQKNNWLCNKYPQFDITIPPTLVITTEGFHAFMEQNNLFIDYEGKSNEDISALFIAAEFPARLEEKLAVFLRQVHKPLSVRSSSLLEDAFDRPFAGLFETYMLPNNHADINIRLKQLIKAVKLVFASTFFAGPRAFAIEKEYATSRDSMAAIIQILAGEQQGDYIYPAVSGVVKSYNYYPVGKMKADEGIAQIALGFGKTVVEGEKCLLFSPRYPQILPQFPNVEEALANSQKSFYALRIKGYPDDLDYLHSNLVKRDIDEAENEAPVKALVSTYFPEENAIRDNFAKGPKVVTFARILKYRVLPLNELLQDLLQIGYKGMCCDIEIEFAMDLGNDDEKVKFHFLQIRPMTAAEDQFEIHISQDDIDKAFCYSSKPLGHGINDIIADIVYVKPETFDTRDTRIIANEISRINAKLNKEQKSYMLVGPGRWGSADPWLGIPVRWEDISGVGTIIELRNDQLSAEDSQGTHFFQNITAMGIKYLTVTENDAKLPDFINWKWLDSLETADETKHLRHVRLDYPFIIKVDSESSRCVILEAYENNSIK